MRTNPILYTTIRGRKYRIVARKRKAAVRRRRSAKRKSSARKPVAASFASRATSGKTDSSFLGIGMFGLIALGAAAFFLLRKKEVVVVPAPIVNSGTPFPMQQQPSLPSPEQQGQNAALAMQQIFRQHAG